MNHRDKRDALRGRVEHFEQELAKARETISGGRGDERLRLVEAIEQALADARRILDELDAAAGTIGLAAKLDRWNVVLVRVAVVLCVLAVISIVCCAAWVLILDDDAMESRAPASASALPDRRAR